MQRKEDNGHNDNKEELTRFKVEDNEGHIEGSRQAGSSSESMEEERQKDAEDDSDLNKTDARGTVSGDEAI